MTILSDAMVFWQDITFLVDIMSRDNCKQEVEFYLTLIVHM